jgi:hypothetical protein
MLDLLRPPSRSGESSNDNDDDNDDGTRKSDETLREYVDKISHFVQDANDKTADNNQGERFEENAKREGAYVDSLLPETLGSYCDLCELHCPPGFIPSPGCQYCLEESISVMQRSFITMLTVNQKSLVDVVETYKKNYPSQVKNEYNDFAATFQVIHHQMYATAVRQILNLPNFINVAVESVSYASLQSLVKIDNLQEYFQRPYNITYHNAYPRERHPYQDLLDQYREDIARNSTRETHSSNLYFNQTRILEKFNQQITNRSEIVKTVFGENYINPIDIDGDQAQIPAQGYFHLKNNTKNPHTNETVRDVERLFRVIVAFPPNSYRYWMSQANLNRNQLADTFTGLWLHNNTYFDHLYHLDLTDDDNPGNIRGDWYPSSAYSSQGFQTPSPRSEQSTPNQPFHPDRNQTGGNVPNKSPKKDDEFSQFPLFSVSDMLKSESFDQNNPKLYTIAMKLFKFNMEQGFPLPLELIRQYYHQVDKMDEFQKNYGQYTDDNFYQTRQFYGIRLAPNLSEHLRFQYNYTRYSQFTPATFFMNVHSNYFASSLYTRLFNALIQSSHFTNPMAWRNDIIEGFIAAIVDASRVPSTAIPGNKFGYTTLDPADHNSIRFSSLYKRPLPDTGEATKTFVRSKRSSNLDGFVQSRRVLTPTGRFDLTQTTDPKAICANPISKIISPCQHTLLSNEFPNPFQCHGPFYESETIIGCYVFGVQVKCTLTFPNFPAKHRHFCIPGCDSISTSPLECTMMLMLGEIGAHRTSLLEKCGSGLISVETGNQIKDICDLLPHSNRFEFGEDPKESFKYLRNLLQFNQFTTQSAHQTSIKPDPLENPPTKAFSTEDDFHDVSQPNLSFTFPQSSFFSALSKSDQLDRALSPTNDLLKPNTNITNGVGLELPGYLIKPNIYSFRQDQNHMSLNEIFFVSHMMPLISNVRVLSNILRPGDRIHCTWTSSIAYVETSLLLHINLHSTDWLRPILLGIVSPYVESASLSLPVFVQPTTKGFLIFTFEAAQINPKTGIKHSVQLYTHTTLRTFHIIIFSTEFACSTVNTCGPTMYCDPILRRCMCNPGYYLPDSPYFNDNYKYGGLVPSSANIYSVKASTWTGNYDTDDAARDGYPYFRSSNYNKDTVSRFDPTKSAYIELNYEPTRNWFRKQNDQKIKPTTFHSKANFRILPHVDIRTTRKTPYTILDDGGYDIFRTSSTSESQKQICIPLCGEICIRDRGYCDPSQPTRCLCSRAMSMSLQPSDLLTMSYVALMRNPYNMTSDLSEPHLPSPIPNHVSEVVMPLIVPCYPKDAICRRTCVGGSKRLSALPPHLRYISRPSAFDDSPEQYGERTATEFRDLIEERGAELNKICNDFDKYPCECLNRWTKHPTTHKCSVCSIPTDECSQQGTDWSATMQSCTKCVCLFGFSGPQCRTKSYFSIIEFGKLIEKGDTNRDKPADSHQEFIIQHGNPSPRPNLTETGTKQQPLLFETQTIKFGLNEFTTRVSPPSSSPTGTVLADSDKPSTDLVHKDPQQATSPATSTHYPPFSSFAHSLYESGGTVSTFLNELHRTYLRSISSHPFLTIPVPLSWRPKDSPIYPHPAPTTITTPIIFVPSPVPLLASQFPAELPPFLIPPTPTINALRSYYSIYTPNIEFQALLPPSVASLQIYHREKGLQNVSNLIQSADLKQMATKYAFDLIAFRRIISLPLNIGDDGRGIRLYTNLYDNNGIIVEFSDELNQGFEFFADKWKGLTTGMYRDYLLFNSWSMKFQSIALFDENLYTVDCNKNKGEKTVLELISPGKGTTAHTLQINHKSSPLTEKTASPSALPTTPSTKHRSMEKDINSSSNPPLTPSQTETLLKNSHLIKHPVTNTPPPSSKCFPQSIYNSLVSPPFVDLWIGPEPTDPIPPPTPTSLLYILIIILCIIFIPILLIMLVLLILYFTRRKHLVWYGLMFRLMNRLTRNIPPPSPVPQAPHNRYLHPAFDPNTTQEEYVPKSNCWCFAPLYSFTRRQLDESHDPLHHQAQQSRRQLPPSPLPPVLLHPKLVDITGYNALEQISAGQAANHNKEKVFWRTRFETGKSVGSPVMIQDKVDVSRTTKSGEFSPKEESKNGKHGKAKIGHQSEQAPQIELTTMTITDQDKIITNGDDTNASQELSHKLPTPSESHSYSRVPIIISQHPFDKDSLTKTEKGQLIDDEKYGGNDSNIQFPVEKPSKVPYPSQVSQSFDHNRADERDLLVNRPGSGNSMSKHTGDLIGRKADLDQLFDQTSPNLVIKPLLNKESNQILSSSDHLSTRKLKSPELGNKPLSTDDTLFSTTTTTTTTTPFSPIRPHIINPTPADHGITPTLDYSSIHQPPRANHDSLPPHPSQIRKGNGVDHSKRSKLAKFEGYMPSEGRESGAINISFPLAVLEPTSVETKNVQQNNHNNSTSRDISILPSSDDLKSSRGNESLQSYPVLKPKPIINDNKLTQSHNQSPLRHQLPISPSSSLLQLQPPSSSSNPRDRRYPRQFSYESEPASARPSTLFQPTPHNFGIANDNIHAKSQSQQHDLAISRDNNIHGRNNRDSSNSANPMLSLRPTPDVNTVYDNKIYHAMEKETGESSVPFNNSEISPLMLPKPVTTNRNNNDIEHDMDLPPHPSLLSQINRRNVYGNMGRRQDLFRFGQNPTETANEVGTDTYPRQPRASRRDENIERHRDKMNQDEKSDL